MKVTVLLPPQAGGAPPSATLLFVKLPLQPPLPLAEANQRLKTPSISACDRQAGLVVISAGQVRVTDGAVGTVKVAWQVVVNGRQELV